MKKSLLLILVTVLFTVILLKSAGAQTLVAEYEFAGTLTDRLNGSTLTAWGPTPVSNGDPSYLRNNVESAFLTDANGDYWTWRSDQKEGGGFYIDVNSDIRTNYSIGLRFSFDSTGPGYRKIIDYQNCVSDNGFYFCGNKLVFYPSGNGTTTISNNQLIDLVVTRSTDGVFKAYFVVNGVVVSTPEINYNAGSDGSPVLVNGKPRFGFFYNDNRYSGEAAKSGKVYGIKIWNSAFSSAAEIQTAMNPKATVANVSIIGATGVSITSKDVVVTLLEHTILSTIAQGTTLSSWVTNLPTGLIAKAKSNINAGSTSFTLEITGTPSTVLSAPIQITVPSAYLNPSANVVVAQNLNAIFAISPYTVTYNGNSSTGGSVPVDGNNYAVGSTVTVLSNSGSLVKTGYTFQGWNTKADGSGTPYATGSTFTIGAYNVMLYARWTVTATPPPTVTTQAATNVTLTTATGNGNITNLGNPNPIAYGVCYGTSSNPTISNASFINKGSTSNIGAFTANITGLAPGTTYYVRAFATNTGGTSYGDQFSFSTVSVTCTFTSGSSYTPIIVKGNPNQPIGRFQLSGANSGASLTVAVIKLNGVRSGASNFKLWYSADNTFDPGAKISSLLGTVAADPGTGNTISFSGFNQSIGTGGGYYFLSCDLASNAAGEIQGILVDNNSLTISSGSLSGTISNHPLSSSNNPLPVSLAFFTNSVSNRDAVLNWKTSSEESEWSKVGFAAGKGTTSLPTNYSFEDKKLSVGKYQYRLKQIDNNGNFEYHNLSGSVNVGVPAKYDLSQNYPNPFNPFTKVDFQLPNDSKVSVVIYDITGKEVSVIINNEFRKADYYTVMFNGSNLSSGVYFYRIIADKYVMTKKMLLLK
ncbi:MAG: InlB B-repeat-containing protein [Ignavibacteriae bacterium]|nr:InlB B-repeat-containing protein [Ignavibacteriota bacterium]